MTISIFTLFVLRMKRSGIVVLCLFYLSLTTSLFAQEWNAARLSLIYGGDIPFNFNSIQKYREGIEIQDATILGITLADSSAAGHTLEGFDLNFRTFNGETLIRADAGSLPLNRIRIKAESYLGLLTGISYGYIDLSGVWSTLFSYTNSSFTNLSWDTDQVSLSFECGKPVSEGGNGSLLGEEPGYYTIEVEIELVPTGPGF